MKYLVSFALLLIGLAMFVNIQRGHLWLFLVLMGVAIVLLLTKIANEYGWFQRK